ncbi:hypothetical protein HGG76_02640 [Ochrobactrum tritici]|uniref:Uncharacterized protein n=1 Tax=Brucella tritici TaxID=94626 RepID=A0A7X6FRV0_9HYPH|nr:hypothetical protein [Brucella tritici]
MRTAKLTRKGRLWRISLSISSKEVLTMGIREERNRFLVTVERASALPGFRRIRRYVKTFGEAKALDNEIHAALDAFGKWPVEEGDKPLLHPSRHGQYASDRQRKVGVPGTLREATQIALDTHWAGKRYHDTVKYTINVVVDFMEARGASNIDDITSEDIDELVRSHREKGTLPVRSISHWAHWPL